MNEKRALELLKHITQDKDYGMGMLESLSLKESIYTISNILPNCISKATEKNIENDIGYFSQVLRNYYPIVLDKIKAAERLWIVYSDNTGYPYELDGDMVVLFDYANHDDVCSKLAVSGFKPELLDVDAELFKNEVGHMYRNGYKNLRFVDGVSEPFVVSREELYGYEEFFNDEYITNPAMQLSMISLFQELRKEAGQAGREDLLQKREDKMIQQLCNGEFMVPCMKEEKDDEVEISHPFIDVSIALGANEGEVIAIPAFTDGFEMDKCYQGHKENMLYTFSELKSLVEELGASGVVLNAMGISYYIELAMFYKFLEK